MNRTFWRIAIAVLLAATIADYAPLFVGRVPFPAQIVFNFPPFSKFTPPEGSPPAANIGDLVTTFYPYRVITAHAAREGSIPLWNRYMLSGAPFLANTQSALFYPPNLLYYVLPTWLAWALGFPLRVLLAGLFTILLVRRIGGSAGGSIAAGLLFAFSGFITVWQGQAMDDTAVWLPLICYSVVRLAMEPGGLAMTIAAVAFAMPVLAGHPETAAHLTLTGVALAVFLFFFKPDGPARPWKRVYFAGYFVLAGILAMGIAAVQMLSTLEWLTQVTHSFVDSWPPRPLWTMLGFVARDISRATNGFDLQSPEQVSYIGMLAFLAVPVAFLHSAKKFVVFFAAWTTAAVAVAYGIGPLFRLSQHAPIIQFLKNGRLILIADFGLAVLAGLGITALESLQASDRGRRIRAAMLASIGLVTAFLLIHIVDLLTLQTVEFVHTPLSAYILLIASSIVVGWRLLGGLKSWRFPALAVAIVAIDVLTFAFGFISFVRPRDIFPPIPLFERLKSEPQPFRIATVGSVYGSNWEAVYGLDAMGGYELTAERVYKFFKGAGWDEMDSFMLSTKAALENTDRRVDMLNTKYLMVSEYDPLYLEFRNRPDHYKFLYTDGATDVIENLHALPAAFVVPGYGIQAASEEAQLARVKDPAFDPEQSVLVDALPEPRQPIAPARRPPDKVEWVSQKTNSFHLKTNILEPGMLVVSQVFYPGWTAHVDGKKVQVVRADYALTGVPLLSPGPHDITFSFMPWSFIAGLTISLLCFAGIILQLAGRRHTFRHK